MQKALLTKREKSMASIRSIMSRAVRNAYRNGKDDETFPPLVLFDCKGRPVGRLKKGDAVIYYNIRGEREVELTQSLTDAGFDKFPVENDLTLHFATMIEYEKDLNVQRCLSAGGRDQRHPERNHCKA